MKDRYTSPLGDRREHPVPCQQCRADTFALDRTCEGCWAQLDDPAEIGAGR